jgi:hypothetical protein
MTSTMSPTMKAWFYSGTTNGLEKNLTFDASARTPKVSGDDILIKVLSSWLNPADSIT